MRNESRSIGHHQGSRQCGGLFTQPPFLVVILLALALLAGIGSTSALAQQNPEDELGNWLIWNGTVRFDDRWSLFTEAQVRLWEVASNLNEWFVRAAGQYDLSPQAMVGLGYAYIEVRPFTTGPVSTENRLYEQFTLKQAWARSLIEHRYRLQVTAPLNMKEMNPGAQFINVYDELFLNFDSTRTFDQNRLYAAWGRQLTPDSNLQLGFLWQARTMEDFFRVQIFYTHNFDLREREVS